MAGKYGAKIVDGFGVEDIKSSPNFVHVLGSCGGMYSAMSFVLCPGPWAGDLLARVGVQLPLQPVKIPVYYWNTREFLPHTFIFDTEGRHVYGLPALEYPNLTKVGRTYVW